MLYQWIISLPMMVCLFWTIFFIVRFLRGSDEPHIDRWLVLFYLASTILYTNHWLYFSNDRTIIGAWLYIIANLSVYPLYYAYLRALTRTRNQLEIGILLIPALLVAVLFPLNSYFGWMDQSLILLFARICFAIQVLYVWACGWQLISATRRRMDDTYTDYRSYLLQPTHILLLLIGVTAVVSTLLNILGRDTFENSMLVYIPAFLMSILLYGLGYIAAHTALPPETVSNEEIDEQAHKATTEETDILMQKIGTALREQQLFTNSHLTIQDLASSVGSNRTYVSNAINRRTGLSFSQYVARYRVEHALLILRDAKYSSDHEAITNAIALSGFTSDQTFYRVFKDVTGLTPLQYRQQNLQK